MYQLLVGLCGKGGSSWGSFLMYSRSTALNLHVTIFFLLFPPPAGSSSDSTSATVSFSSPGFRFCNFLFVFSFFFDAVSATISFSSSGLGFLE
uniref:Uncharacterized protein n=1 Tax=Arundo donax TaxID=35708 RepID=A0A0A9C6N0_ARUDO